MFFIGLNTIASSLYNQVLCLYKNNAAVVIKFYWFCIQIYGPYLCVQVR